MPRDHWLTDDEKDRICAFARRYPTEGYRRLTFMMLDHDEVACSPASVYRVLKKAGLLASQSPKPTRKGTGFVQPVQPHEHWHIDVSYLNIAGTFYFLCSILDGCSRTIIHWQIREKMEENDVEIILQRARECHPSVTPRIITDNGPQFIAKDFKEFIRICGMSHVKTSPYYPQANGKIERWHKSLKSECIRPQVPMSLDEARRLVANYVEHYNTVRLHSAIGYIAPKDRLEGRHEDIFAERDRKLAEARERRKAQRQSEHERRQTQATKTHPMIDFAALRDAIDIAAVLDLLGFDARSTRGGQMRGPCPLHGSTSGTSCCFSANLRQHLFQCFKCGRAGNALDLWAAATTQTPYDAALDLCERLGIELPLQNPGNREEEPVVQCLQTCTMP